MKPNNLKPIEYTCNLCKIKFKTTDDLKYHLDTFKHTFMCYTCNTEFPTQNSLHNHFATHEELRLFACDICKATFKTRKDLSKHASVHEKCKNKICKICLMTFKTTFHLKRHEVTRHSDLRPFKCDKCEMTFARKDKLKQHAAKHIDTPIYQCSECSKGFYRKEHLKDHEITKHSKQYPFQCENCHKGFVHAKDLHRHIRVRHLGFLPLKRENDEFKKESEEVINEIVINNEPEKIANKPFSEQLLMIIPDTSHQEQQQQEQNTDDELLQLHHQQLLQEQQRQEKQIYKRFKESSGSKSFKCIECNKNFYYENHLKKHILSKHTNNPLYACSVCKSGFVTKSTAKSHVENSHASYICTICTKSFRTRAHAQRHINLMHNNEYGLQIEPQRNVHEQAEVIDLTEKNKGLLNKIMIDSKYIQNDSTLSAFDTNMTLLANHHIQQQTSQFRSKEQLYKTLDDRLLAPPPQKLLKLEQNKNNLFNAMTNEQLQFAQHEMAALRYRTILPRKMSQNNVGKNTVNPSNSNSTIIIENASKLAQQHVDAQNYAHIWQAHNYDFAYQLNLQQHQQQQQQQHEQLNMTQKGDNSIAAAVAVSQQHSQFNHCSNASVHMHHYQQQQQHHHHQLQHQQNQQYQHQQQQQQQMQQQSQQQQASRYVSINTQQIPIQLSHIAQFPFQFDVNVDSLGLQMVQTAINNRAVANEALFFPAANVYHQQQQSHNNK